MDKLKKIASVMALCILSLAAIAQEKADFMRSNGKIYVVVAVVVTIVVGLFIYLVSLDRKIRKMEKNQK